jgi:hypothetical protein
MADVDDGSIANDACLLRRIRPDQIVDDANLGTRRPSSAAFKDADISVDAEPVLKASGLDWKVCLQDHPGYSLVNVDAGHARDKSLAVICKPLKDDPVLKDNPAHTEVVGKKTQAIARHLAANSTWVHLEPKSP